MKKIRITDRSGTPKLRFLLEERLPSGALRIRFRRKGSPTVTLNAPPGTDDFMREYLAALEGNAQLLPKQLERRQQAATGTLRWLITHYYGSAEFKRLNPHTQHVRRLILDKLCQSTDANGIRRGDKPYAQMEARNVRMLRDEKANTPEAANQIVKMLRQVFAYAVVVDLAKANPAKEVPYLKTGTKGFHTWTMDEVSRFEERHRIGTKAWLALALMLYTGQRRSDIIQFGRQHVKNGWLKITQQKNRNRAPITVEIPVLPELQNIIDASPCGDLTFLVTEFGRPFTSNGFGNWFRDRCIEAGVPGRAHGLRKATATRLAELGATDREIMAVTGHQTSKEVDRYTKAARRKVLAENAMARMASTKIERK
jgi:integrase